MSWLQLKWSYAIHTTFLQRILRIEIWLYTSANFNLSPSKFKGYAKPRWIEGKALI